MCVWTMSVSVNVGGGECGSLRITRGELVVFFHHMDPRLSLAIRLSSKDLACPGKLFFFLTSTREVTW